MSPKDHILESLWPPEHQFLLNGYHTSRKLENIHVLSSICNQTWVTHSKHLWVKKEAGTLSLTMRAKEKEISTLFNKQKSKTSQRSDPHVGAAIWEDLK